MNTATNDKPYIVVGRGQIMDHVSYSKSLFGLVTSLQGSMVIEQTSPTTLDRIPNTREGSLQAGGHHRF